MNLIVGIDEVGRGAWAGPLVVGAVALKKEIDGLTDSKKLNTSLRERLAKEIHRSSLVGLGWVTPIEIDELGLTKATGLACERALENIKVSCDEIVIDGSVNFMPNNKLARCMVKADSQVPAVSAASIVAKVARDNYMREQSKTYINYGFEKNVGYGTKLHIESLKNLGISPIHRLSYKPLRALNNN
jgi:ribonuclease HII